MRARPFVASVAMPASMVRLWSHSQNGFHWVEHPVHVRFYLPSSFLLDFRAPYLYCMQFHVRWLVCFRWDSLPVALAVAWPEAVLGMHVHTQAVHCGLGILISRPDTEYWLLCSRASCCCRRSTTCARRREVPSDKLEMLQQKAGLSMVEQVGFWFRQCDQGSVWHEQAFFNPHVCVPEPMDA